MYQRLLTSLDAAITGLLKQASGRQVSLMMLGPDHEIAALVRQASEVTAKITPVDGQRERKQRRRARRHGR